MGHNHNHNAHHDHGHNLPTTGKDVTAAFIWGIGLNSAFVIIEGVAGILAGSMALLSDAGHNLSDVASLLFVLIAFRLSKSRPTENFTYGYKKSTVLVSMLNAVILLIVVGIIISESIDKIISPRPVEGGVVAWVAGIGIIINAFTAWLFFKGSRNDINIKGAYLHLAADALVSVGVMFSGVVISLTGWNMVDPIIGLAVAIAILISTWGLLRDSTRLSLDGVPLNVDVSRVKTLILSTAGVKGVHHLHIWAISTTQNAMTAHLVLENYDNAAQIKELLKEQLKNLNISHVTIEAELPSEKCHCDCC
ncbi:MAG: cation diffusion facilitator family transporter [Bacteroidales bacterium]